MGNLSRRLKRDANRWNPVDRLKEEQHAPSWLTGAGVWVGVLIIAVVAAVLVISGMRSPDAPTPPPTADDTVVEVPQHEVNPHDDGTGGGGDPSEDHTPEEEPPEGTPADPDDYADETPVEMDVETGEDPAEVPQGAVNVANAGARGTVSGNWSEIPSTGDHRDDRYLGVTVDFDSIRLFDAPPADEAPHETQYTFLFDGQTKDGSRVQFSVTTQWEEGQYVTVAY